MEFHQEQQEEDEDEEMPLPINTTYGHNHIVSLSNHHHKPPVTDVSTTIPPPPPPQPPSSMEEISKKMVIMGVRYKECLKNHAASMGGKATDGCGEFMPCGEEGTMEAFTCSVCNCHRNFHRKEIEGVNHTTTTTYDYNYQTTPSHLKGFHLGSGRNLFLQAHHPKGVPGTESLGYNHNNNNNNNNAGALVPCRGPPPPMIMSYNMAMGIGMGSFPSESDDQVNGGGGGGYGGGYMSRYPPQPPPLQQQQVVKKRFRTKFTQEQKEKMMSFAEKVGWKIQRQDESVVQDFCQEIGIKRRVLKVWMHNNKQNLAKNTNSISINPPQHPS